MATQVYYFTGTGNSLFAARELAKRLPDASLVPLVAANREPAPRTTADTIGFVFPVHALTIPIVVRRFIRKLDPQGASYFFAVATRDGTLFRGFEAIDRLLRRKRRRLDAGFILRMGNNESRHANYHIPTPEEIRQMEDTVLAALDRAAPLIERREAHRVADTTRTIELPHGPVRNFLIEKSVLGGMALAEHIGGVQYFYADEKCTGCGICAKICPSGKVTMADKRPVWRRETLCYMCFACLNYCPPTSVQIRDIPGVKSYTTTNGRYPHPYAGVNDIAAQRG